MKIIMKIIWTDKGLINLRFIVKCILVIAYIAIVICGLLALGSAGSFDAADTYNPMSEETASELLWLFIISAIIAVISVFVSIVCKAVNESIDKELQKRYRIADEKKAAIREARHADIEEFNDAMEKAYGKRYDGKEVKQHNNA